MNIHLQNCLIQSAYRTATKASGQSLILQIKDMQGVPVGSFGLFEVKVIG